MNGESFTRAYRVFMRAHHISRPSFFSPGFCIASRRPKTFTPCVFGLPAYLIRDTMVVFRKPGPSFSLNGIFSDLRTTRTQTKLRGSPAIALEYHYNTVKYHRLDTKLPKSCLCLRFTTPCGPFPKHKKVYRLYLVLPGSESRDLSQLTLSQPKGVGKTISQSVPQNRCRERTSSRSP